MTEEKKYQLKGGPEFICAATLEGSKYFGAKYSNGRKVLAIALYIQ
jgi:hypothetical protein